MARTGRTYSRDARGRFASGGGSGKAKTRPAARRAATRAGNRLNRDNAGRIAGIGRNGATVRGGRLKTASGKQRATQTAAMKAAGFRAGTIAKGGRGVSGKVARSLAAVRRERAGAGRPKAADRPGSITSTLRGTMRALAQADAQRIREIEAMTGQKVRPTAADTKAGKAAGAAARASAAAGGSVTGAMRTALRGLAQSDARAAREMGRIVDAATPKVAGGKGRKAVAGGARPQLPAAKPATPAAKPRGKRIARGPKTRLPRRATPTGAIRKSDLAKVKADAAKGIGTPQSRAGQRAFARSAREAPLIRKQAIQAAKRRGATGFGKGPQVNTQTIGSREYNWNRNEQPATARERLAMWRRDQVRQRNRSQPSSPGRAAGPISKGYAGALRASRRAAELVSLGNRRGDLPTTRRLAEEPRQRRVERISRNDTQGRLASNEANRTLMPKIMKNREAANKRIAEGKKPTPGQLQKERDLVGQYNKMVRKLQVAQAAKAYTENPYGYKPQRMSAGLKPKPASSKPSAPAAKPAAKPATKPTRTVYRTRAQAAAAQGFRRNSILDNARDYNGIGMRKNPRIRKRQTGMFQLSLIGKAKPLVRFRPVSGSRR